MRTPAGMGRERTRRHMNPAHLASNIAIAVKGPLPEDLYQEARKLLPLPGTAAS